MASECNKPTGDSKLDRRIVFWKVVIELYTAALVTVIFIFWLTKGM
jgi:hypothetical protein